MTAPTAVVTIPAPTADEARAVLVKLESLHHSEHKRRSPRCTLCYAEGRR